MDKSPKIFWFKPIPYSKNQITNGKKEDEFSGEH